MTTFFIIVGLSLLILAHELGHFAVAKLFKIKVDEFGFGFPPKIFGKKFGETEYTLNALPFGGFVKIYGENGEGAIETEKELNNGKNISFVSQPSWKKASVMLAGVTMNILFGWFIFSLISFIGIPEHLAVIDVSKSSPAEIVGIKSGDFILEAQYGDIKLFDPVRIDAFSSMAKNAGDNQISLKIQSGKEIKDTVLNGRTNPPASEGSLGVSIAQTGASPHSFFESIIYGAKETYFTSILIVQGFYDFLSKIFIPGTLKSVAGPVGIVTFAKQASDIGFVYFFQLLGLISLNLAVLNLIPFPALDGGRVLIVLFEKIKGSPVSNRIQMWVNATGFIALIILMILVTIQDVTKLLG